MKRFGGVTQPWIEQVCDGVRNAVQNGIENLSGSSIATNSHPEDGYRFRARTAEELKATQHLVPSAKIEDLPPDDDTMMRQGVMARPSPKGWIL